MIKKLKKLNFKNWKILLLFGGLSLLNFVINFSEFRDKAGNAVWFAGVLSFVVGILFYEFDVFVASLVIYFVQSFSEKFVMFKDIRQTVMSSFLLVSIYILINTVLSCGLIPGLSISWAGRRVLYIPVYVAVFFKLKKNMTKFTDKNSWLLADASAGTVVLMILTGF